MKTPSFEQNQKHIVSSLGDVVRSELRLAKVEIKDTAKRLGIDSTVVIGGAVAAVFGIFSLLAAAVIGLGELLNDNYWLSALIVGFALVGGGIGISFIALSRLKHEDVTLPETRLVFDQTVHTIDESLNHTLDPTIERKSA